jgi:hypothetical protein
MKKLLEEFNNPPMKVWAVTTALVVLFAVVPSTSFHLDDNSGEHGAAKDAIAQIKHENHIASVGKKVCGENSAWQIEGNTIQCMTHRGARTSVTAQVNK